MSTRRSFRLFSVAGALTLAAGLALTPITAEAGSTTPVTATPDDDWHTYYAVVSGNGHVVIGEFGGATWWYDRTTGERKRVDLNANGDQIDVAIRDLSDDGRYLLFSSESHVLDQTVHDDCGFWRGGDDEHEPVFTHSQCLQLYLTDTLTGSTQLASVGVDGEPVPAGSQEASLSSDGRYVAMTTGTPLDTEQYHQRLTLVRDLQAGVTEDVGDHADGTPADGDSLGSGVAISDDGNLVVFGSQDGGLAGPSAPDANGYYVHDRSTDTTSHLFDESLGLDEYLQLSDLSMSDDGSRVAFYTGQNLVPDDNTGNYSSVYLYDRPSKTLTYVGPGNQDTPRLSGDGNVLTYNQYSADNERYDVHALDVDAGSSSLASVNSAGELMGRYTMGQSISDDGRFLGFVADDNELEPNGPGEDPSVQETRRYYVRDLAPPSHTATGTGAASTGADPTVTDPLVTTVAGSPGTVTIEQLAEDPTPLTGWNVLGQQTRITAAPVTAAGGFMTFTFTVDRSVTPPTSTPSDVQVLRNGGALPDCAGATDAGPCVASRDELPSGDWQFVAHSPQASVWALATAAPATTPPDTTGPTITLQKPANGATYVLGQKLVASYSCTDDSGVTQCAGPVASGARVNTSSIGSKTFTVNAKDGAGNTSSASAGYRVVWPLNGFQAPVDNPPVVNLVKRGSVVPVVFSLGGYRGTSVFASGSPASAKVGCTSGRSDALERTLKPSSPTLAYASGKYTYAWRTDPGWRGTCRKLTVRFADGQERTALFRFW